MNAIPPLSSLDDPFCSDSVDLQRPCPTRPACSRGPGPVPPVRIGPMASGDKGGFRSGRARRAGGRWARPLAEGLEGRRLLAVITVNSAGDADGADGSATLSLRQAIEVSNGTLPVAS